MFVCVKDAGKLANSKMSFFTLIFVGPTVGLAQKNRTCLDNPVILSVKSYHKARNF